MSLLKKIIIGVVCFAAYLGLSLAGASPWIPLTIRHMLIVVQLAMLCSLFLGLIFYAAWSFWQYRRIESGLLLVLSLAISSCIVPVYFRMMVHYFKYAFNIYHESSGIPQLKTEKELVEFIKNDPSKLTVVNVSAVWCFPCQQLKPIYQQLALQLGTIIKFAKVDIDLFDKREVLNITSLPTLLIYKNGVEISRIEGFRTYEQIKEFLIQEINSVPLK